MTRRDLSLLLPVLAAGTASAQKGTQPSKTFVYEELPVKTNGKNRSRAVFDGETHGGFPVELHMTQLAPGEAPHPPHHHSHDEVLMLHEGTLEVTISGKVTNLTPGSVAFVASNEEHGWKNPGNVPAQYFVMALGKGK